MVNMPSIHGSACRGFTDRSYLSSVNQSSILDPLSCDIALIGIVLRMWIIPTVRMKIKHDNDECALVVIYRDYTNPGSYVYILISTMVRSSAPQYIT